MYSVHQHWDPLRVCMVGRSYPPEFYSFVTNSRVRKVLERVAQETEEDYQKLVTLLEKFGVEVLRPTVTNNYQDYMVNGRIRPPPMVPRDWSAMIGNTFYMNTTPKFINKRWDEFRGVDWPQHCPQTQDEVDQLPDFVKQEIARFQLEINFYVDKSWDHVIEQVSRTNKTVLNLDVNSAMITRIGRDLYFGTESYQDDVVKMHQRWSSLFPEYRCHVVNTGGHSDSTFCPVVPGLIVSLMEVPTYTNTFPDWEVVYLPGQSWDRVSTFLQLKNKNQGKWWVPGEELNNEFTDFVESWLDHWVGYVEETVFDVNMLVIDQKNVVCNNYNKQVFDAFDRHGITAHVVNFRHRYFWDGGLHCITSDLHRIGTQQNYFPQRD